jgi:hypothetical protein
VFSGGKKTLHIAGLAALTVALYVAGGVGMAYVAGFSAVELRLDHAHWWWLAPAAGGVVLAFCGYLVAYRGMKRANDGPELDLRVRLPVVAAGFGGFFVRGGTALDEFAMRAGGADKREAKVRINSLIGLELGVLALIVCGASIVAWALGDVIPRKDFTQPWAIAPPIGLVLAIFLAERYRDRLRDRDGWRGKVGIFFDAIHMVFQQLRHPTRHGGAVAGMVLYWAGDMFALWAATAAFGFKMTGLAVIVALATGMLFTRRTAPLGGAGVMLVALVPTLWYGAAVPFAAAVLGVAAYRLFTLFGPMVGALVGLPALRELGRSGEGSSGEGTSTTKGEPALQH